MRRIVIVLLISAATTGGAFAQQLKDAAQWCYAASDMLETESDGGGSEYREAKEHLGAMLREIYEIGVAQAKTQGLAALRDAAQIKGVSTKEMALTLYRQACKSVFLE